MMALDLTGAKELEQALLGMERKIAKKAFKSGLAKAANVILKQTRSSAKQGIGGDMGKAIARSLQSRLMKNIKKRHYGRSIQVNPKKADQFKGVSSTGKDYYIPAAIEYGHLAGGTFVPPIPFMRRAYEHSWRRAHNTLVQEVQKAIKEANSKK